MSFLKTNLPWIAPTAAIVLLATGAFDRMGDMLFEQEANTPPAIIPQAAVPQAALPQTPTAEDLATERRVQALNQSVASALETSTGGFAAPQTADIAEEVVPEETVVTRNAPLDLLQVTPEPEPLPVPQPVAAIDTDAAADFFASAQQNLVQDTSCYDDLKELAALARVYFPTGGLVVEDAGLSSARLIGMVAQDCPGYSVQVEGHSDPSGDPGVNQRLSEQRAQAVIGRLASSGIDTANFVAIGFGDTQPSNVRGPETQAYYDRRVEFSIVPNVRQARFSANVTPAWGGPVPDCARVLETTALQARQFYAPRAIMAPADAMATVYDLAAETARCDGAWLRIVGHFSDAPGSRENAQTARLRALAMFSSLTTAGFAEDRILIGAPSYSADVAGQPGMPKSRVEFQIITD